MELLLPENSQSTNKRAIATHCSFPQPPPEESRTEASCLPIINSHPYYPQRVTFAQWYLQIRVVNLISLASVLFKDKTYFTREVAAMHSYPHL
ncbi:hypothetical protein AVEN_157553-1 [Araneus ventricosus]|uniref:Uncharacterized protein n=1 Tax=Araneus ventricosus TaxID=182803 RepID=A0A4Y2KHJ2_ARAVE|nr:hypothetical protein AVEN_157553-1 [Araneus ventricosus]